MLSPDDIRLLCERRYPRFLRSLVTGEPYFPMKVPFGKPSTSDEFDRLQTEISALADGASIGYRIEWEMINTRRWGRQRLPIHVSFESEGAFLALLQKHQESALFRENLAYTRVHMPQLLPWVAPNVMRMVEFGKIWRDLLIVCQYFLDNPRPARYARELVLPVDTKFVERNTGILRLLLDELMPSSSCRDTPHFEERFGLRYEEPLIRFRLLDAVLRSRLSLPVDDLSVPLSQFQALDYGDVQVLIVENKMTFLTLPALPNGIGVFGGGVAAGLLASVSWLARCDILYWGDLDVHGLHILARLRKRFPQVKSVMMDAQALERFMPLKGRARPATHEFVDTLTESERAAYSRLQEKNVLIEQEKIEHTVAVDELRRAWRWS